jgi:hypothetical protein
MADYRQLNQALAAEVEAVSGTQETPTVAANAIKARGIRPSPNFDVINTDDEHTGSLDGGAPIIGGGSMGLGFGVVMRGSGAAGTAPEYDPLLQGCGFAVTTTAAAVTDTAQAGAANTITLAAGDAGATDAYKGMVIELTGGTGSGQSAVIMANDGTSKVVTVAADWATQPDATTTYSIVANVLYRPASLALKTVTLFNYQHSSAAGGQSLLRKLAGAAGNMNLEITNREIGQMNFEFTGILPALPGNVAHPGEAAFDDVAGEAFKNAEVLMGGKAVKFRRFTLDLGNEVSQADDPAATYGLDVAGITRRKVTGTIKPNLVELATQNNMSDFMNQTAQSIVLRWGSAAGKRLSLLIPTAKLISVGDDENDGYAAQELGFQGVGADDGVWICVH